MDFLIQSFISVLKQNIKILSIYPVLWGFFFTYIFIEVLITFLSFIYSLIITALNVPHCHCHSPTALPQAEPYCSHWAKGKILLCLVCLKEREKTIPSFLVCVNFLIPPGKQGPVAPVS